MLLNNCHHIDRLNLFFDNQLSSIDRFESQKLSTAKNVYLCKPEYKSAFSKIWLKGSKNVAFHPKICMMFCLVVAFDVLDRF